MKCKCGNEDKSKMMVVINKPHRKITCGLCGKFMKFGTKEDVNVIEFNGGMIKEV